MKIKIILFAISIVAYINVTNGQSLPHLSNVSARCRVTINPTTGFYNYNYTLSNGAASTGNLRQFSLDITRGSLTVNYDTIGLIFEDAWVESAFRTEYAHLVGQIIPVGFSLSPNFWDGLLGSLGVASFGGDGRNDITPGNSLDSFQIMSKAPPGIRTFSAKPYIDVNALYPNLDDVNNPDSLTDQIRQDEQTVEFHGESVGPTDPPAPPNNLNFLDTIKSYINQSRSLVWISVDSTKSKYLTFMDSAKAQLNRSDTRDAWVTLDTATVNAQRDSGSTLTSEGYALIFFNAKYLMTQLPPPPSKFTLTVAANPLNGGSVSKSPNQTQYDSASSVTLTANATGGHHFQNWSGNLTGTTNPVTITMNSNKNDTANFAINTFTITASVGVNGSISPSGAVQVDSGSSQRFTFAPNTGYHTDSVIVDNIKKDSTVGYTFTNIIAAHTIRVTFKINMYTVVVSAGPGGNIAPSGTLVVPYDTTMSFIINPASGHEIDSILVNSQPQPITVPFVDVVTKNDTIRVAFISLTDTVTQHITTAWNMVSLAAHAADTLVRDLYPSDQTNAFYFSSGYQPASAVTIRLGYWLHSNKDTTINYHGYRVDSIHLYVTPGWNMIGSVSRSVPVAKIIGDSLSSTIFKFASGTGYTPTSTIDPGYGYWLHVNKTQPQTIIINGSGSVPSGIDAGGPPAPPGAPGRITLYSPINNSTGLPIVPSPAWYTDGVATSYTVQLATNTDFDPTAWQSTPPQQYPPPVTQAIQVGPLAYSTKYYWRVQGNNQAGSGPWSQIWWFTTQSQPPPPPCQCCVQSVMQLDGFTVKDNAGNGQQMYTLNGGRKSLLDASFFDMPPAPKPGIFHARFHSSKFIQTVQPGKTKVKILISVTDAVYPLTFAWTINPDNQTQYWVTTVVNGKQQQTQLTGTSGVLILDAQSVKNGSVVITAQASQPPPCGQQ